MPQCHAVMRPSCLGQNTTYAQLRITRPLSCRLHRCTQQFHVNDAVWTSSTFVSRRYLRRRQILLMNPTYFVDFACFPSQACRYCRFPPGYSICTQIRRVNQMPGQVCPQPQRQNQSPPVAARLLSHPKLYMCNQTGQLFHASTRPHCDPTLAAAMAHDAVSLTPLDRTCLCVLFAPYGLGIQWPSRIRICPIRFFGVSDTSVLSFPTFPFFLRPCYLAMCIGSN